MPHFTRIAEGTTIMRFDDEATIQALMPGQVDARGGNQVCITRIQEGASGKFENKTPPAAPDDGVGARLGEADWNQAANAFLTEFMAPQAFTGIHNARMKMDPPQLPTKMEGVPFTIVQ